MFDIDFSIPYWLTTYYHVIGVISILFDSFSIYLVLFRSDKIDNFRYFLLYFQLACTSTDIILTFLMQPVELYPILAGYSMGFLAQFGVTTHFCLTMLMLSEIYQIESMIFCFLRKHQTIASTLRKYAIPNWLVWSFFAFLAFHICAMGALFSQTSIDPEQQMEYVRMNFPEYLQGFQSLPNFSIYEADAYFLGTVIFAVSCGIFAFLVLCIVIANIFRMLSLLKTQISASNYQKHRAAVWSLLAQFATSGVCFIPPLALVFVALFSINRGQCRFISVIVEYLLVIACSHSSLNVLVLIATFPPYRKYVLSLVKRKKKIARTGLSVLSLKPSQMS